jgi:hypothetical protein
MTGPRVCTTIQKNDANIGITTVARVAQGINIGNLLVSNSYTDVSKVPVNGAYIKGNIVTDGSNLLVTDAEKAKWNDTSVVTLRPMTANIHDWITKGSSGMWAGEGDSITNAPDTGWWRYIGISRGDTNGYITLLAFELTGNSGKMHVKTCVGGAWGAWVKLAVNKSDVGLGNVPNTDATNPANIAWTASYRSVTDTEKSTWNNKVDGTHTHIPSNITQDSNNRFVTDSEKSTWNGKQAALNGTGFVKISGTTISYDNSTYAASSHNQAATTITEDTTHRFVTDSEKSTWNGKQNILSEMTGTILGLVKLNGNYTFTGTLNVPTPALP